MPDSALDVSQLHRALVIDDEEAVRGVLRRWLTRKGWEVVEAHDGEVAMDRLRDHHGTRPAATFDVVICDLRMPTLSGMELHAWLFEHRPELAHRVVFSSGDVREPAAAAFLQQCGCPVLEKPFELARLGEVITALVARS